MKVFIVDNYDSFTFNLVQQINNCSQVNEVVVRRNDKFQVSELANFDRIILSPGPSLPQDAGLMNDVIVQLRDKVPILGVCLGHQAIAEVHGGELVNLDKVIHGQGKETIVLKEDYLFKNVPEKFITGRYHSWVTDRNSLNEFDILATDRDSNVMAIRHKRYNLRGVQFHPESILTEYGDRIIQNFINQ